MPDPTPTRSPALQDSTGQAMVSQLAAIAAAIGGGGGGAVQPDPYDASVSRYTGYSYAYLFGDYCTYQDVMYVLTGADYITANSSNPPAFDSTIWTAFDNIYDEIFMKPGRKANVSYNSGERFNDRANVASGNYAHAEGYQTRATGQQCHAEGGQCVASNYRDHAEGSSTTASGGTGSHAEGSGTTASGTSSHAEGYNTTAYGSYSHAEGSNCRAMGYNAHAEGSSTNATYSNSHAEGSSTAATAEAAHVEGYYSGAKADYSHAEGYRSVTNGSAAHAEGGYCEANGYASHAEGYQSKAGGSYAGAYGWSIETGASYEHSMGMWNETVPDGSALAYYNADSGSYSVGDIVRVPLDTTNTIYQCNTAIPSPAGTFDPSKWDAIGTYDPVNPILFSIGNGQYGSRRNALEIRRDGTFKINGNELPKPPATDGTYTLQCTVSNGAVTYAWV